MIAKDGNKWKVDLQPGGRKGRRIKKWFGPKSEAKRFEQLIISKHAAGLEWNKSRRDTRKLSDLISRWHEIHGISLQDGDRRPRIMLQLAESIGRSGCVIVYIRFVFGIPAAANTKRHFSFDRES